MSASKTKRPSDRKPAASTRRTAPAPSSAKSGAKPAKPAQPAQKVEEIGGRDGPDPTRYGDYEKDGRCVDF